VVEVVRKGRGEQGFGCRKVEKVELYILKLGKNCFHYINIFFGTFGSIE
jgi:hypothetical protein